MKTIYFVLVLAIESLAGCSKSPQITDVIPEHETFTIESIKLGETRTINVWMPPEYAVGNDSFPVLYMPDGGIKEDFPHIANTLAELIQSNKIPPIMLVGIENTKRQRDLTGPTEVEKDKELAEEVGESANFRAFITDELIPKINEKYRTTSQKGIIGESLAGLFVMETFLLNREVFDFYIAFDPSLWWNNHYYDKYVEKYLNNFPEKRTRLWFASSSAKGMSKATLSIADALQKVPTSKLMWRYSDEPNQKHNTIFRATKEKAIIWVLNVE